MANNMTAFKAEFLTFLQNTPNLDLETKQDLRDNYVRAFQAEWDERVAGGTNDTPANRARFAVDKIVDAIKGVYRHGARLLDEDALPPPAEFE